MAPKKLAMEKIENHVSRQVIYTKRKENIIKKANELSTLCDTDVGLIMLSSPDNLTAFATNGRVEDIFIRFVDRPDYLRGGRLNNKEFLSQKLKQIKHEREMLEKITVIEELQETLVKLNKQLHESHEKMRYYKSDVAKINSIVEADVHKKFLSSAIKSVQLSKDKLLGNQVVPTSVENIEDYSSDGKKPEWSKHESGTSSQPHLSEEAVEGN